MKGLLKLSSQIYVITFKPRNVYMVQQLYHLHIVLEVAIKEGITNLDLFKRPLVGKSHCEEKPYSHWFNHQRFFRIFTTFFSTKTLSNSLSFFNSATCNHCLVRLQQGARGTKLQV